LSTQKSLIDLQKESFEELQRKILEQRKYESRSITKYRDVYLEEVDHFDEISSKSELLKDVEDAQIIYCGDFHTLPRSQYTAIKILRSLVEQKRKVYLALEMIPINVENVANDFVDNEISEKEFLEEINYERIWGFPWSNYQPLFEFARQNHISILGLNSHEGGYQALAERDVIAAERMVECILKQPDAVIFCLYGDLHIAQKHIPQKVENLIKKKTAKKIKTVTVFQNSDEIYWNLLNDNVAHKVDVVKISQHSYCVLSSTPWIKWQSYQSWVDEHGGLLSDKEEEETFGYYELPDFFHDILDFAKNIQVFLQEEVPSIDDFEVYTALDTQVMDKIEQYFQSVEAPKKSIQKLIDAELIENRSILIPDQSVIYLLDFSQTRAAEKAAQWVSSKMTDQLCVYGKDFDEKELFYRLVIWEAIGYFGSKIVNPKRKCDQYKDFERLLERMEGKKTTGHGRDEKIVAQEVLKHRDYEMAKLESESQIQPPRKIFYLKPKLFFMCAQSIGEILGDQLYSKVVADRVSLKVVTKLFTSLSQHHPAQKMYLELAGQIKSHQPVRTVSKDELF
jgi:uncharacterized iron-regulated protein